MAKTFLSARWENLIMANYEVNPDILTPFLPTGVELDLHEGKTLVSLVGFMFKQTKLFKLPIPFLGTFEEINLRFYVKRVEENETKRGVVFINETVPYKAVAWMANKLYKENYIAIPTDNQLIINANQQIIHYSWKKDKRWNEIIVNTSIENHEMIPGSTEEFIFEHYYGYTKTDRNETLEYRVNHPKWNISEVLDFKIDCDFESMYGKSFGVLNNQKPHSVVFATGSEVTVDWKRKKLNNEKKGFTIQNLCCLRTSVYLAQEVGKSLG